MFSYLFDKIFRKTELPVCYFFGTIWIRKCIKNTYFISINIKVWSLFCWIMLLIIWWWYFRWRPIWLFCLKKHQGNYAWYSISNSSNKNDLIFRYRGWLTWPGLTFNPLPKSFWYFCSVLIKSQLQCKWT